MLPATRQRWVSRLYPQPKQVLDLATPEGCKAELIYVIRESHRPGIEPATCKSQVQRHVAEPPRTVPRMYVENFVKFGHFGCFSIYQRTDRQTDIHTRRSQYLAPLPAAKWQFLLAGFLQALMSHWMWHAKDSVLRQLARRAVNSSCSASERQAG